MDEKPVDDGSGQLEVWRVENFKLVPWPKVCMSLGLEATGWWWARRIVAQAISTACPCDGPPSAFSANADSTIRLAVCLVSLGRRAGVAMSVQSFRESRRGFYVLLSPLGNCGIHLLRVIVFSPLMALAT